MREITDLCWDTSKLSQLSNWGGVGGGGGGRVTLGICLDHEFQQSQEDLKCQSFAHEAVT